MIADEGASVHYVEGCTAPVYTTSSLHSAVVEIVVVKYCARSLYYDSKLGEQCIQFSYKTYFCYMKTEIWNG
ncbi:SufD family Fe-S cluster assembly protein [Staphylococcus aureus]